MKAILSLVVAATLVGGVAGVAKAGQTFDTVKSRGQVACGVHTGLGGFGAPDQKGNWAGLDVDVCRAVAAAMFGDAKKVRYVPLSAQQRLPALQSGEVDLLSRNTTWTLTREASNGLLFAAVDFYDGQGFLVAKKLGVKTAKELNGATVCVQTGTTTELNLSDFARANKLDIKPVTIESFEEAASAFISGRCDAMTSDGSQLAAIRANQTPVPDDYVILPERISKEPLATAVRQGDDQWFNLVKWAFQAMVDAEEHGITSANVDAELKSADPNVQRLLGVTPGMGKSLGVDEKWAYNIIKQVGNYGESYDRNVGKDSKLKLERGLNDLWNKGGLMYAMPIR
ncbi:amino acid ABC transporter substrate-binding protein [Telmatospirillum sp.]|uniref:amino acid ABC transporter substrate-binding protein n=1 Tax=Telmatospirillum sp. TaxID=2079197 RepID=UPI002847BE18|nr:amino acid ABC transporter substrate-binding protein [Telmatospirillum sp.]MDR3440098.1 amino acid ABC transporter substrate-binding protein [Telmatospirillum sp.]